MVEESRMSNPPVLLPIFPEDNLPSAKLNGVLIAVDDGAGNFKLGISREGQWFLFNHDSVS